MGNPRETFGKKINKQPDNPLLVALQKKAGLVIAVVAGQQRRVWSSVLRQENFNLAVKLGADHRQ